MLLLNIVFRVLLLAFTYRFTQKTARLFKRDSESSKAARRGNNICRTLGIISRKHTDQGYLSGG